MLSEAKNAVLHTYIHTRKKIQIKEDKKRNEQICSIRLDVFFILLFQFFHFYFHHIFFFNKIYERNTSTFHDSLTVFFFIFYSLIPSLVNIIFILPNSSFAAFLMKQNACVCVYFFSFLLKKLNINLLYVEKSLLTIEQSHSFLLKC